MSELTIGTFWFEHIAEDFARTIRRQYPSRAVRVERQAPFLPGSRPRYAVILASDPPIEVADPRD